MADKSAIEWTDATWTPIRARNRATGKVGWHCEHATTGCEFCYAEGFNKRLGTGLPFKPGHRKDIDVFLDETMLTAPLRWKKPRMIFVCSMTDLFADFVPDEWIDKVFAIMALAPQHTFQVLTKRAKRMREYLSDPAAPRRIYSLACDFTVENSLQVVLIGAPEHEQHAPPGQRVYLDRWPLQNVWLGVSAERQQEADERIPELLATPAAIRFVSAEPLLGPINIVDAMWAGEDAPHMHMFETIDWIIVGGESGSDARPMHPDWARWLRDQCKAAGTAFFFKQWGEWTPGENVDRQHGVVKTAERFDGKWLFSSENLASTDGHFDDQPDLYRIGKKAAGRWLDGIEHNAMPEAR